MVDTVKELKDLEVMFAGTETVGITSGASTPEEEVNKVIEWFKGRGTKNVIPLEGVKENMHFAPIR